MYRFWNELGGKKVDERADLDGWSSPAGVESVKFDGLQLVVGKNGDQLAGIELGPAHPSGSDRNSEPCFRACDRTFASRDPYPTLDGERRQRASLSEAPPASTRETRTQDAIVAR